MKFCSKLIMASCVAVLSAAASAGPLNEFNLVLFGDLKATSNVHVYGKALITGDLNSSGEFGSRLNDVAFNATNNVEVLGSVSSSNLTIQNGYLAYGDSAIVGSLNCNEGGIAQGACVRAISNLAEVTGRAASIYNTLSAESAYYASLAATGAVDLSTNTFKYTGVATDLAVFDIAGADLFSANANWKLDFGSALNVVLNVSGEFLSNPGSVNLTNGFSTSTYSNILWNFTDATSLNLGNGWKGSVLALDADIKINNDIDGSVAAKSYTGNGQIHHFYWDYTPPETPVSEPPMSLLLLAGLGMIGLGRLRRRSR